MMFQREEETGSPLSRDLHFARVKALQFRDEMREALRPLIDTFRSFVPERQFLVR